MCVSKQKSLHFWNSFPILTNSPWEFQFHRMMLTCKCVLMNVNDNIYVYRQVFVSWRVHSVQNMVVFTCISHFLTIQCTDCNDILKNKCCCCKSSLWLILSHDHKWNCLLIGWCSHMTHQLPLCLLIGCQKFTLIVCSVITLRTKIS